MKRRIGLNVLYLVPGEVGGTETYARGLIKGLIDLNIDHEFILLVNQRAREIFDPIVKGSQAKKVVCSIPLNSVRRHIWEQRHLAALCRQYSIDLLHSLGYISPIVAPCKRVVSILDMLYKRSPGSMPFLKRLYWTAVIPLSARTADAVVTISQYSKDDIVGLLKIPEEKVFVTLLGPGQELGTSTQWEVVKKKYGLPEQFFLSVGTAAHKRLDLSVSALRTLQRNNLDPPPLVITGRPDWGPALAVERHDRAIFIGFVPREDLAALYAKALAVICTSELEGFGLPVLEAMAFGTPVIAFARGAVAEIAGPAGLLVDPGNAQALAEAMRRVIVDKPLRSELSRMGLTRVDDFSWKECAKRTVEVYEWVLARRCTQ